MSLSPQISSGRRALFASATRTSPHVSWRRFGSSGLILTTEAVPMRSGSWRGFPKGKDCTDSESDAGVFAMTSTTGMLCCSIADCAERTRTVRCRLRYLLSAGGESRVFPSALFSTQKVTMVTVPPLDKRNSRDKRIVVPDILDALDLVEDDAHDTPSQ